MRAFWPRQEHNALYGITAEVIAKIAKVHVTTARRWKRGEEPPYAALRLIEFVTTGNLEVADSTWTGWRLRDGKLIAPHGEEFTRGEILSIRFMAQQVAHLQSELRCPRQADWISEKWDMAPEVAINE
jgi:hypothetical protein